MIYICIYVHALSYIRTNVLAGYPQFSGNICMKLCTGYIIIHRHYLFNLVRIDCCDMLDYVCRLLW